MAELEGRRIVVTGASRGIGRAIARACARSGATVGINYLRSEKEARALPAETPGRYVLLPFDVRDPVAVEEAIARFRDASGGPVDGWVNNAAVNLPDLLVTAPIDRVRDQVDTNLLGPIICTRAVLPHLLEARRGVIVNLGSVAAARPARGQAVYAATKGALESFTRAVAVEYARKGVRCHCVRPGPIATDMIAAARALAEDEIKSRVPMRRLGLPEEVAELVVFLLSDRASFATGAVHTIDGGYLDA